RHLDEEHRGHERRGKHAEEPLTGGLPEYAVRAETPPVQETLPAEPREPEGAALRHADAGYHPERAALREREPVELELPEAAFDALPVRVERRACIRGIVADEVRHL